MCKILEAIKDGFTPNMPTGASTGEFFKGNDRKLNALVKSTTDDLKRAETAVLRMSNDKYRKAILTHKSMQTQVQGLTKKQLIWLVRICSTQD